MIWQFLNNYVHLYTIQPIIASYVSLIIWCYHFKHSSTLPTLWIFCCFAKSPTLWLKWKWVILGKYQWIIIITHYVNYPSRNTVWICRHGISSAHENVSKPAMNAFSWCFTKVYPLSSYSLFIFVSIKGYFINFPCTTKFFYS